MCSLRQYVENLVYVKDKPFIINTTTAVQQRQGNKRTGSVQYKNEEGNTHPEKIRLQEHKLAKVHKRHNPICFLHNV
jgi:hypothetical protein